MGRSSLWLVVVQEDERFVFGIIVCGLEIDALPP